MYRLRNFRDEDWEELKRLHLGRGFEFPLPKVMPEAVVVEDEITGKVVQIIGTRETRECFVWMDAKWATPRWRWDAFAAAHEVIRQCVKAKGLEDVKLWTDMRGFARKLCQKLGWRAQRVESFYKDL